MPRLGYSHVPEEGFLSLAKALEQKDWGTIDVSPFLDPAARVSPLSATQSQGWKIRLVEKTQLLALIVAGDKERTPLLIDDEWDQLQRQLDGETYVHTTRKEANKRDAALRVRKNVLLGGGTGQTRLSLEKEVDWGRTQVRLSKESALAQDILLLGLGSLFAEIEAKTEELAQSIKHSEEEAFSYRSVRIRGALTECQRAADAITNELEYFYTHEHCTEAERRLCAALLAPLIGMAERYFPEPEKPAPVDPPKPPA